VWILADLDFRKGDAKVMTVKEGFKFGLGFMLARLFVNAFGGALIDIIDPAFKRFTEGVRGE
jgi:hypothetical protein